MIAMTLAEIAAVVGGSVAGDESVIVRGSAFRDNREPVEDGLFVAIAGERVDGHDFAESALASGAAAVVGTRPTTAPTVVVDDVVVALGRLARHVVDVVRPTVLALTGSQGKTGTKDFLAQLLADAGETVATSGNLNNELGVPLTVLRCTPETDYLVVEMGARGIGHIAELCRIAPPDVAAVLNVGTAHLGEFGSREAIAQAKGELVEALGPEGTAVLNADDDLVLAMRERTPARVLTFGANGDVAWRGVELDDLGRPSFELGHEGAWRPVSLQQSGAHQVVNATAAAAMAIAAGVGLDMAARSLTAAVPASRWRMELHERRDGLVVVNDAYNANPASMRAAIDALVAIGRRRGASTVAVLGEMLELGESSEADHRLVGAYAAEQGVDVLLAVGAEAAAIAAGAGSVPQWQGTAVTPVGRDDALAWVRNNVAGAAASGGSWVVLVKASRGAALETVAEGLLDEEEGSR
ncbi:UDP-N-acetylmuramoyl-tripeptide--D-alanyl-D-alanine ligase [Nocardioides agariphilus]|uniref:UDP-N-acetylmuramoyl-tripeptide--D-alanyl-D-alanine ligase n=1 Tax=Nocardioides agariphilus TaxID=433664 RepID=A0A930VKI7_9ACTN|nr:UDP-N-acetylmuramoyl-tripeptide--D-alanyl-D-alanine ligase [Nocardioides agariphilus]